MAAQVVEDDDVAGPQGGCEALLDVGAEALGIHGAVEDARCGEAVVAQGADEGGRVPVAVRHGAEEALAARAPAVAARHVGRGAGFVDEDQPRRI